MGGRKGELIQRLIQFGMENCTTYTSTQASNHNPSVSNPSVATLCDVPPTYTSSRASNHNPSVSNPSVANLCDVLPTYTSSQAFDPNQTVSNSSGIHPLSMDQAPPRDPPRSNAPNHPIRIQNTNVVRAIYPAQTKQLQMISYRNERKSISFRNIVIGTGTSEKVLYGKNHQRIVEYIEDIVMQSKRNADGSNTLNIFRMVWKDKQWKIKTGKTRKRPKYSK
eukprot:585696_1